jgi:hypothetical protein
VRDLIALLRQQAEQSSPPVRPAALMRIARVEAATDAAKARQTFERGLEEARRLSGRGAVSLMNQALLLAAAVSPDLMRDLPAPSHGPPNFRAERLARVLLQHEHGDAAFDYVMAYDHASTFPFHAVSALIDWYGDDERRQALLRRALAVWREAPDGRFLWLFGRHWKGLPEEEARDIVREIARVATTQPDRPLMARYQDEVEITSLRANTLFQILHVLRRLDATLAESLIAANSQLAAAARRFPNGMESIWEEARARRTCPTQGSTQSADFELSIRSALEQYEQDRTNQAPREFWPSTRSFRGILHRAGTLLGEDAAVYLERIPDPDLRLFAGIELAAALAGLPEL